MTKKEFEIAFAIIAPVKIADEFRREIVKAYCFRHFSDIEKMAEVRQLSIYIDKAIQAVERGDLTGFADFVMFNPAFILSVHIPINMLTEEIAQQLREAADDFPQFLLNYFAERGVDLMALSQNQVNSERLQKFERIMRGIKLGEDTEGTENNN